MRRVLMRGRAGPPVAFAVALFVLVVATLGLRLLSVLNRPGSPSTEHWGMQDFRDAVYYPALAWREGHNPYDRSFYRAHYPVGQNFSFYSPLTLLLHAPLTSLPLEAAEAVYFFLTLALTVALAHLTLHVAAVPPSPSRTLLLASFVLLSRPGHMNLVLGQVAMPAAIGTLVVLQYAQRRPQLAGLTLALVSFKPTYFLPLAVLLTARRDYRVVVTGVALGAAGALMPLACLVLWGDGPAQVMQTLWHHYVTHADGSLAPISRVVTRVDAYSLLARVTERELPTLASGLVGVPLLAVAWRQLRRLEGRGLAQGAGSIGAALMAITVLISTYHHVYDMPLLLAAAVATFAARQPGWSAITLRWRRFLLALMSIPAVNYVATNSAIQYFEIDGMALQLIAAINATALLTLFLALCATAETVSKSGFEGPDKIVNPRSPA